MNSSIDRAAALRAPLPHSPSNTAAVWRRVAGLSGRVTALLDRSAPLADLLLRLFVAQVFWASGLVKAQSFDSTVLLFTYEYSVPLLPPMLAALLATATELGGAALLALGLAGRFAAAALFTLNLVAVISYPALMADAVQDHKAWGLMLLVLLLRGPGALSCDALLLRWLRR